jgi:hypothetical protein
LSYFKLGFQKLVRNVDIKECILDLFSNLAKYAEKDASTPNSK